MATPKKKKTPTKQFRTAKTEIKKKTEETTEKKAEVKTPAVTPRGHRMETRIVEEFYNACRQNLHLGGQVFVPGAQIPKEFVTPFYLEGGHIGSRKRYVPVRVDG